MTEQSARLEPVGTTALLVALLLLVRRTESVHPRHELLAGAALGLGAGIKIWGVVPWLVLVGWEALRGRWAAAGRVMASGAAALAVLLVPFFVAAPTRMFDMVVRDQFRRPPSRPSLGLRVSSIFGIGNGQATQHLAVAVVVVVLLLLVLAVCFRDGLAQPIILVFAADLAVLLTSPSFFRHYAEFVAAPAVLLIGIATGRVSSMVAMRRRWSVTAPAVAAVLAVASATAVFAIPEHVRLIGREVARAAPGGCLKSDDPGVLIQLDRLSDGFRGNCNLGVDVWGVQQDSLFRTGPDGRALTPAQNTAWQQWLVRYLTSGDEFVLARPKEDGLAPASRQELDSHPLIAAADGVVVRRGAGR